jgi:lactoylglutathione lyase
MHFEMIHVCLRVLDLQASESFYQKAFGFEIVRRKEFPGDFTLSFMAAPGAPFELELTWNVGRSEPYEPGTGFSHVAVGVADLEAAHQQHLTLGLEPGPLKGLPGSPPHFYFVTDPDGYKVEVVRGGLA